MHPQLRPQDHEVRLRAAEKALASAKLSHSFACCDFGKAHEAFAGNPVKPSRLVTLVNAAQALRDADIQVTEALALVAFLKKECEQQTEA